MQTSRLPGSLETLELYGFNDIRGEPLAQFLLSAIVRSPAEGSPLALRRLAIGTDSYPSLALTTAITMFSHLQELSLEVQATAAKPYSVERAEHACLDKLQRLPCLRSLQLKCPLGLLAHTAFMHRPLESEWEDPETQQEHQQQPFPALRQLHCDFVMNVYVMFAEFPELRERVSGDLHLSTPQEESPKQDVVSPVFFLVAQNLVLNGGPATYFSPLNTLTTLSLDTDNDDELMTLQHLPSLRNLTLDLNSALGPDKSKDSISTRFLSTIHSNLPALETLRFESEKLTAGWHAFTIKAIQASFFRAALENSLRHVHIKRCVTCFDDEDIGMQRFDFCDMIGRVVVREDLGFPHCPDRVDRILNQIQELNDSNDEERDPCWHEPDVRLPTRDDVVEYLQSCGPCEAEMTALFEELGTGAVRQPTEGIQYEHCEIQLRRALMFWKSVYPRLKFTIGDALDHVNSLL